MVLNAAGSRRSLLVALLLLFLTGVTPAQHAKGKVAPVPVLPFYAENACPFEGCAYREWTALSDTPAFSTWDRRRKQHATVRKGAKVVALGGIVITSRPGVIHLDRDYPEAGLKRGDTVLTYTYLGEGFSQVWVNGRFFETYDISFTKWPDGTGCGSDCAATYVDLGKKAWWAKLRMKSDATVWVEMDDDRFAGTSLWESPQPPH